jgi:hypothetical protein
MFRPFDLLALNDFLVIGLSNLLPVTIHGEGYSRNASCAQKKKIDIYVFYYQWIDTYVGGLLVPGDIIRLVISVSTLTWFI